MPKRTDANHAQVMVWYRQLGCTVTSLHEVGRGCPDLLIGHGVTDVAEVKDGDKPPSARKLTELEQAWHDEWLGSKVIVESLEDVQAHVKAMRARAHALRSMYLL